MTFRLVATVLTLAVLSAPAFAHVNALPPELRTPEAPPAGRPAPAVQIGAPVMDFRIVEGRGVFGLQRWIQATGQMTSETADRFDAFLRENRVKGMTIAFDSPGGSLQAGLRVGRAIRAAGLNTTVGRTVVRVEDGRLEAVLVTHHIECNSACSYAFLGGIRRSVASTATLGVHQFSRPLGPDGRFLRETPTLEEFQTAQWVTAQLALYVQEMGADMHFLVAAANHPFGQQLYALTRDDLMRSRAAIPAAAPDNDGLPVGWSRNLREDVPMLFRRTVLVDRADRRVVQEVFLACHQDAGQVWLQTRMVAVQDVGGEGLSLSAMRVELGAREVSWRNENGQPVRISGVNATLWVRLAVPRDALVEGARAGRIAIELPADAQPSGRSEIGAGLAPALEAFNTGCDGLRERLTARAN